MMKMLSLASLMVLAFTASALTARGDDPATPEVKLSPEMQATLAQLLKTLGTNQTGAPAPAAPAPTAPAPTAAPAPAAPAPNATAPAAPAPAGTAPAGDIDVTKLAPMVSQLLKMLDSDQVDDPKPAPHSEPAPAVSNGQPQAQPAPAPPTELRTSSLRTGGLVTGTLNGTPRLTKEQWRALFPIPHN